MFVIGFYNEKQQRNIFDSNLPMKSNSRKSFMIMENAITCTEILGVRTKDTVKVYKRKYEKHRRI